MGFGGLTIVDLSDRGAPHSIANIAGPAGTLAVRGDFGYLFEASGAVHVWNLADGAPPHEVGTLQVARGAAERIAMFGNRAVMAIGARGLAVLDLTCVGGDAPPSLTQQMRGRLSSLRGSTSSATARTSASAALCS